MALLLNPRAWIAIVLAIVLGLAGAFLYKAGKATVRADFDAYRLSQQEARILADKAQRTEEQRRQTAVDKEAQDAQIKITALEADARAANDAAGRLHAAIGAVVAGARKDSRVASAGKGEPGTDPLDLLSGMLYRHSQELVAVGKYADELSVAGSSCERIADRLQPVGR